MTPVNESDFELWLEWEEFEASEVVAPWDNDDPEDDFFNMYIRLPDGRCYALNVWTYRMLERAHQEDLKNGDNLGGAYLLPPDLFVQRRDRSLLEAVVRDLLQSGGISEAWRADPDDWDVE